MKGGHKGVQVSQGGSYEYFFCKHNIRYLRGNSIEDIPYFYNRSGLGGAEGVQVVKGGFYPETFLI